jgi:anti-sigma factor RsiW
MPDMPTPPKHFKDEIQALLDERLDAAMRVEVERHLQQCEECRREFEAFRWTKRVAAKRLGRATAPAELRETVLRALKSSGLPQNVEAPPASFWRANRRPILAWAAVALILAILSAAYFHNQRTLLDAVAQDFRDYQSRKLGLELYTSDAKQMEAFFATHGIAFNTRVFDLGMMNYQLSGGRVERFHGQPAALFVYRGPANQVLHCRMYAGSIAKLPPGAIERENKGIKFHIYRARGLTMVFWQEGAVVCVLSSDIESEEVVQLAFAKAMTPGPPLN